MKKIILYMWFLIPFISLHAQWDFSAAMGLDFKSSSSYRDYVNSGFAPADNKLSSFGSAVNFVGEVDYLLAPKFQMGLEYSILIDSYSTPIGPGGIYEISYTHHRPSVMAYYVIAGNGYKFKFGGGIGLRYVSLVEKVISSTDYSALGAGVVLRADGNTILSDHLYVLVGFDLRYDFTGDLKSKDNQKIFNFSNGEAVNLNSLGVGIKLGLTYSL